MMMVNKEEASCPVCGSRQYRVKYTPWVDIQDPLALYGATSGVRGTQTLVSCAECGVIYENPRYTEDVILQGYAAYNESAHDSQHAMRAASFLGGLEAVRAHIPAPGAKVLDVGTAGGAFLEAARQFGYDAVGLEPSRFMAEQARQRGLNVIAGTLEEQTFAPESFDMVCLWDVLEHVARPRDMLARIRGILKPQGVLLINYPDIGTPLAKLAGKRFWWILSVHLVHFDRNSMRKICDLCGFEVFHFQPYWQTLEFGYLEEMAEHLKVPLSGLLRRLTPQAIRRIPVPYYASQTTALARLRAV